MGGSVRRIPGVINQAGDCPVGDSAEEDRDKGCSTHHQQDDKLTRFRVARIEHKSRSYDHQQSDHYRHDVRRDANQPGCLELVHSTHHTPCRVARTQEKRHKASDSLVPGTGLEPVHPFG
jgi:hypothetical protein